MQLLDRERPSSFPSVLLWSRALVRRRISYIGITAPTVITHGENVAPLVDLNQIVAVPALFAVASPCWVTLDDSFWGD